MKQKQKIAITPAPILEITLEIEGTADLIQNKFSQKAVDQMLRKHMGMSVEQEKKKPREVLETATIYNTDRRVCIPPTAIKKAMLTASTQVKGFFKTALRAMLFVQGNSLPITYKEMVPRMDITRLSGIGRKPDVRFRPAFVDWHCRLTIQFSDSISVETVLDLLKRAGSVGVGEWRPEKDGNFGTFRIIRHISTASEIAQVQAECAVPLEMLRIPDWAMDTEIDATLLQKIMASQTAEEGNEL